MTGWRRLPQRLRRHRAVLPPTARAGCSPTRPAVLEMLVRCCNGWRANDRPRGLPADITLTERRVLTHVAAGRSNAQIAETLCISVGTVRKHLEHAYRKLGSPAGWRPSPGCAAATSPGSTCRSASTDSPEGVYPCARCLYPGRQGNPHDTLGGHHDAHPSCGDGRLCHHRHDQPGARARLHVGSARRSRHPTSSTPQVHRRRPGRPGLGASLVRHRLWAVRHHSPAHTHPFRSVPPCSASSRSPSTTQPAARRTWAAARSSAAVDQAAHDVLLNYYPLQADGLQTALDKSLDAIGPGHARNKGVRIGADTARDTCGNREGDGYLVDDPATRLDKAGHRPATGSPPLRPGHPGHARRLARLAAEPGRRAGAEGVPGHLHARGRPTWVDGLWLRSRALGSAEPPGRHASQAMTDTALFYNSPTPRSTLGDVARSATSTTNPQRHPRADRAARSPRCTVR